MTDLSNTLFQYFTREHLENNLETTISEAKWEWFLDTFQSDFASACGDLANELWEENESDFNTEEDD